jgi:hypothetical protein
VGRAACPIHIPGEDAPAQIQIQNLAEIYDPQGCPLTSRRPGSDIRCPGQLLCERFIHVNLASLPDEKSRRRSNFSVPVVVRRLCICCEHPLKYSIPVRMMIRSVVHGSLEVLVSSQVLRLSHRTKSWIRKVIYDRSRQTIGCRCRGQ